MKRSTKMLFAAGNRGGRQQENAREWRITEENNGGSRGQSMGYGGMESRGNQQMGYGGAESGGYEWEESRRGGRRTRMGGYEGEESRRGGRRTRMGGYETGGYETGGYEMGGYGNGGGYEREREESRRGGNESRRGSRRTRMGGYDEDEQDEDDMPRMEYRPPNVIGFNVPQHHGSSEHMSAEVTQEKAQKWVGKMKNEDSTAGPHWTFEQAKQLMAGKNIELDPVEFWVALNMMYSDYYKVAKKNNVNTVDFYAGLAEAFLKDRDAGDGKLAKYFEYVVG